LPLLLLSAVPHHQAGKKEFERGVAERRAILSAADVRRSHKSTDDTLWRLLWGALTLGVLLVSFMVARNLYAEL
jgi:hypothetical protein